MLRVYGPGAEDAIRFTTQGVVIEPAAGRAEADDIGLDTVFMLEGDFQIMLHYEFLPVRSSLVHNQDGAAGQELQLYGTVGDDSFLLNTLLRPAEQGEPQAAWLVQHRVDGQLQSSTRPAESIAGVMMLSRAGRQWTAAASSDGNTFETIGEFEMSDAQTSPLRISVRSPGKAVTSSVKLTGLTFTAAGIPADKHIGTPETDGISLALLLGVVSGLVIFVCVVLIVRRNMAER